MSLLTHILGWPLVAAIALAFVPRNLRVVMRAVAILATFVSAVLSLIMFLRFSETPADASGFTFAQQVPWD